ncbi:MAG: hypothetical protein AB8B56_14560 [Crocinitomicaceae bacterium]
MKKVIYIGVAVIGLALVSCNKQDVQPNSADPVVPTWKANTGGGQNVNDPNMGGSSNEGGITDPEHNEEVSTNNDGD